MTDRRDTAPNSPPATHRDAALELLDAAADSGESPHAQRWLTDVAAVHATLAQVDAIDRLTDTIERAQFPTLEVKKCLGGLGFTVRPKS